MKYREIEIYSPKDLGAAGVEVIDLNMKDCLTAIIIRWVTTVVTVSDMTATHVECISKIEIVDGSDVLFSLSGQEAQALHFATQGVMPLNNISVVAADYMISTIPIFFGRSLYDPELAFDPTKFKSPQLRITWDEDVANASVVVNQLTVRGLAFDEQVIAPAGFFMSKEIKSFTPVASSYEYTEMPVDYPYRLLLMQMYSTDKSPLAVLGQLKLSEEHDKRIPYDLSGAELFDNYNFYDGIITERVRLNETAGDAMALYLTPTYLHAGVIQQDADVVAANDDFSQPSFAHNKVTIPATVNYVPYQLLLTGYCPYGCMWLKFGDLMKLDDLYDVTRLDHLRLVYQGASAVGTSPTTRICTQQLRTY